MNKIGDTGACHLSNLLLMNKSLLVLNLNGMIKCLLSSMGSLSIYLTFRELD